MLQSLIPKLLGISEQELGRTPRVDVVPKLFEKGVSNVIVFSDKSSPGLVSFAKATGSHGQIGISEGLAIRGFVVW